MGVHAPADAHSTPVSFTIYGAFAGRHDTQQPPPSQGSNHVQRTPNDDAVVPTAPTAPTAPQRLCLEAGMHHRRLICLWTRRLPETAQLMPQRRLGLGRNAAPQIRELMRRVFSSRLGLPCAGGGCSVPLRSLAYNVRRNNDWSAPYNSYWPQYKTNYRLADGTVAHGCIRYMPFIIPRLARCRLLP